MMNLPFILISRALLYIYITLYWNYNQTVPCRIWGAVNEMWRAINEMWRAVNEIWRAVNEISDKQTNICFTSYCYVTVKLGNFAKYKDLPFTSPRNQYK